MTEEYGPPSSPPPPVPARPAGPYGAASPYGRPLAPLPPTASLGSVQSANPLIRRVDAPPPVAVVRRNRCRQFCGNVFRGGALGIVATIILLICLPGSLVGVILARLQDSAGNYIHWEVGTGFAIISSILLVIFNFVRDYAITRRFIFLRKAAESKTKARA